MTHITARIPLIDWSKGFDRHWNNNNPASSHVFNALSFVFPQGERFFIKAATEVSRQEGLVLSPELAVDIKAFVMQEAMHTKHHQHYNENLERLGYKNVAYNYIEWLEKESDKHLRPIQKLAFVCAYEHFTAVLGNYVLKHPEVFKASPQTMKLIWGWHAAEETEHKAVCFDLYQAAGGKWLWRIFSFAIVGLEFSMIFTRIYLNMLWRDGCLNLTRLPKTLFQATRFFWGIGGVGWHVVIHGIRYLSPWFHPWNMDNRQVLDQWLVENHDKLSKLS